MTTKRPSGQKWSVSELRQVRELNERGWTNGNIARQFGCTRNCIAGLSWRHPRYFPRFKDYLPREMEGGSLHTSQPITEGANQSQQSNHNRPNSTSEPVLRGGSPGLGSTR